MKWANTVQKNPQNQNFIKQNGSKFEKKQKTKLGSNWGMEMGKKLEKKKSDFDDIYYLWGEVGGNRGAPNRCKNWNGGFSERVLLCRARKRERERSFNSNCVSSLSLVPLLFVFLLGKNVWRPLNNGKFLNHLLNFDSLAEGSRKIVRNNFHKK